MTERTRGKSIHPIVKINYLPRTVGFILFFIILTTIFHERRDPLFWGLLFIQSFIWPQLAFVIGKHSRDARRSEYAMMRFEAVICGLWMVFAHFSLLPSTAFFVGIVFNMLSTGGPALFLSGFPFIASGIAVGILLFGFQFVPDASLVSSIASIIFIVGYSSIVSFTSYRFSRRLGESRKSLKAANDELVRARDQLWGEMQLAKKIQSVLLPRHPQIAGYQIAAYMQPADEVGGDYYDIIHVHGYDWIVIGDVSGHGVPAGLIMMMVQTSIHTVLSGSPAMGPGELLARVNTIITENIKRLHEDKYMTITVFACMKDGRFYYSGLHQDIMIYRRAGGTVELLETDGMWIGIMDDITGMMSDSSLALEPGDVMLLYTDGITEAWRRSADAVPAAPHDDMFGTERLAKALRQRGNEHPDEIKNGILADLQEFTAADDITLLIIKKSQYE